MIESSILWQYPLFDGLEQEQIESILPLMEQETWEAGTEIIGEGSRSDRLFFILEGRVAVIKGGMVITEFDEGAVFGEMEVVDVMPAEATIKAVSGVRLMTLSIGSLGIIYETDLQTYSFILMNLARDLSRRLRRMDDRAANESPFVDWG